jgi:hypothetical protein
MKSTGEQSRLAGLAKSVELASSIACPRLRYPRPRYPRPRYPRPRYPRPRYPRPPGFGDFDARLLS